jgi:hypothetical protein
MWIRRIHIDGNVSDVLEYACLHLPDIIGGFVERIVVPDLRIKMMSVRHIVEVSVDGNGLVDNGLVNSFEDLVGLVGSEMICLACVYVDGRLLHIRANVLSEPSMVGQTGVGKTGEAVTDLMMI